MSCYRYARQQRRGQYLTRDVAAARRRRSSGPATAGVGDACYELGVLYENGGGRAARPARARPRSSRRDATAGQQQACARVKYR